ncbi:MAG: glycosyltransferase [Vulcanibacillus sp.]
MYTNENSNSNKLKVVQINTVSGVGSTGRNVLELAESIKHHGIETLIAYGYGTTSYENSYKIVTFLGSKIHNLLSRLTGLQGYFSYFATKKFTKILSRFSPDLVHINNLHGNYINLKVLYSYLSKNNIPIVYTLHDCWAFTGKCAHYIDVSCNKWQTECSHCPKVHDYPKSLFFDRTSKIFNDKKKFYFVNNITFIGVSKWIMNEAQKSPLLGDKITYVYNWIDLSIFKYDYDIRLKTKYNIPENKIVILGVSGKWSINKGIEKWNDLSDVIDDRYTLVLVGNMDRGIKLSSKIINIKYTKNQIELAKLYSAADIYLSLSKAESFGKTIAESLACGTPVIVKDVSALPELVGDRCGETIKSESVEELLKAIEKISKKGKGFYREYCVNYATANFSRETSINRYYNIYISSIEGMKNQP